jgi:propanol-preferring alcohol dehydrogenase
MKAMVLEEIAPIEDDPLRLRELPEPEPGSGEVRLKVRCCAICRTDLHVIEGDLPRAQLPVVPGHQVVGRVERLGSGCGRLEVGQRVGVAWLRHTCGACAHCRAGRENLCEGSRYTGYHSDGGFAEHTVVPEEWAYLIPDGFDDLSAAPLLCAGMIGYRALKRSDLKPGGTLAIFGFGSSAHVVIQIALHWGCKVFVVTRGKAHREHALAMGAAWAGADAARMPEPAGSAILFAPAGELVPRALEALDKGGTLALAGIHMSDVPRLTYERHLFHERNIRSVTANTRADGRELLALAAQIPIRPIVETFPLQQANQALLAMKQSRIQGTGVLVMPD